MRVRCVASSPEDRDFIARAIEDEGYRAGYDAADHLAGMREGALAVARHRFVRQPASDVTVTPRTVGGMPCEVLAPAQVDPRGLILYLHGGGFVRGSLALQRANASLVARAARTTVLAVGYRQAPEHPFPAAPDDVARVYAAVLEEGARPATVAILGESSGGCLALGLAVRLADRPGERPAGIAAISPMVDLSLGGASWLYNARKDIASLAMGRQLVELYLGGADPCLPLASPIRHDFRGCCPLLIGIGSHETMLSDAEYLARKASEAGTSVRLDIYEAMPHGFTRFDTPIAEQALAETAEWLRRRVSGAPPATPGQR